MQRHVHTDGVGHEYVSDNLLCGSVPSILCCVRWRRWRRATHETFGREAVEKYQHVQAEASTLAALRMVADPDGWERYVETYVIDWALHAQTIHILTQRTQGLQHHLCVALPMDGLLSRRGRLR